MKIIHTVAIASAVVLAAGCAHETHQAQYDESISPHANSANAENSDAASVSDGTLVSQLRQSLQRDAEIAPIVPNIQITANDGTVVLSGSVQSEEQKRQIESIVHGEAGVVSVNNQLQVSTGQIAPTSRPSEDNKVYNATGDNQSGKDNTGQPLSPTSSQNSGNTDTNSVSPQNPPTDKANPGQALNPTSNNGNNSSPIYQNANGAENQAASNSAPHLYKDSGSVMNNPGTNASSANQQQQKEQQ
jgi:hypothetical protein